LSGVGCKKRFEPVNTVQEEQGTNMHRGSIVDAMNRSVGINEEQREEPFIMKSEIWIRMQRNLNYYRCLKNRSTIS
jgi:hypothetical protein